MLCSARGTTSLEVFLWFASHSPDNHGLLLTPLVLFSLSPTASLQVCLSLVTIFLPLCFPFFGYAECKTCNGVENIITKSNLGVSFECCSCSCSRAPN